jgi:hypothetical protein
LACSHASGEKKKPTFAEMAAPADDSQFDQLGGDVHHHTTTIAAARGSVLGSLALSLCRGMLHHRVVRFVSLSGCVEASVRSDIVFLEP